MIKLKDYFDFLAEDDIRIKGTRIGIETVIDDYLNRASPEEIAARYYTLNLEQVYATILYYLHNQEEVEAYMEAWRQYVERSWQEQQTHPSEFVQRMEERIRRRRGTASDREAVMAEDASDYRAEDLQDRVQFVPR